LPLEDFLKYQKIIGFLPESEEKDEIAKMPEQYEDMLGWENQVATVAQVYNRLSPEEKEKCVIAASNYGEAGALDLFGKKYGLPPAISYHNNYWIWGPGAKPGEIIIAVGGERESYLRMYQEVQCAARAVSKYSRPLEEDVPVYLCRRPKMTLQQAWPQLKDFS
jgi:hypothetical protein